MLDEYYAIIYDNVHSNEYENSGNAVLFYLKYVTGPNFL